jgi:Flp pilus assembly protein TadB
MLARSLHLQKERQRVSASCWGQGKGEQGMLWTIIAVLLVLWLLGFIAHVGGGLIHLLLVIALVVFVINLLTGRRTV